MFERFTDRSRRVLVLAQEEARELEHPYIGPVHLLLGLIAEGGGVAAQVLASVGVEREPAREAVRRLVGPAARERSGSPPFTPGAKRVLELALRETLELGASNIGTEHLLLGLVAQDDGVTASVLAEFGTGGDDLRRRVESAVGGRPPQGDQTPRPAGIVIEQFFDRLTARDWSGLGEVLSPDLERIGPFGDRVSGRARYLDLLAGLVPGEYRNDVHRVTAAPDGRSGFARVTEHLTYPDRQLHLEEAYSFHFDEAGLVSLLEVFWQTPESDPGGFGSATSSESDASNDTSGPDAATEAP